MKAWQILVLLGVFLFFAVASLGGLGVIVWMLADRAETPVAYNEPAPTNWNGPVDPNPAPVAAEPWRTRPSWRTSPSGRSDPFARNPVPFPRIDAVGELPANSNRVMDRHRNRLVTTASSQWSGSWVAASATDGRLTTTWYSMQNRGPIQNGAYWIQVAFPEDVTVTRVTVLGNRDAHYGTTYTMSEGTIELWSADGKVLARTTPPAAGAAKDFDLKLPVPVSGVRSVKFIPTKHANGSGDVAVTEIQVE